LKKHLTIEACIENLQNSHTDRTMVTDKSPRTREIAKINESGQVETSESSVVTYLVTASERQQCKDNIKENKKTPRRTTKQPNKTLKRYQRGYIIELERTIKDRDNTITIMERRITQLEENNQRMQPMTCFSSYNNQNVHNQNYDCKMQHLMNNVRALEMQMTQHMCINTSFPTQLAMQLQQFMLQRSATTSNTPVNTSIPRYNYSPLNFPDAPQYHNMNGQQHSTIHSMSNDLNKPGNGHNNSVGHEGRTPYFGPSQPWQPVQHMPVAQLGQYTPAMQPA
jgi:hypothetical protein